MSEEYRGFVRCDIRVKDDSRVLGFILGLSKRFSVVFIIAHVRHVLVLLVYVVRITVVFGVFNVREERRLFSRYCRRGTRTEDVSKT